MADTAPTRLPLVFAVLAIGALVVPGPALAQSGSEARGATILRAVQQGEENCGQLSDSDFELAGEAWMGQTLGSTQAHDSMNRLMSSMMGSSSEEQMHQYLGRRATGCGGGSAPSGFGQMMGTMAMMGGAAGTTGGQGAAPGGNYGLGSMMGGSGQRTISAGDVGGDGPSAAAMVGMMAVLIGAIAIALAVFKPWRHSRRPQELLDRRFAAGELSAEEYRRSKSLMEAGG